jgi:excisionase family DNA binding protein
MTELKAYPIKDVCRRLQIGRSTIYEQIAQGRLQSVKIGKRRLILADDLNAFLAAHREQKSAA